MSDTIRVDVQRQLGVVRWLVAVLGLAVFPVDHPGLTRCAGVHPRGSTCDSRGKHPAVAHWSRQSTHDPAVAARMFEVGLRNVGVDAGRSGLLVVDEDAPGELDRAAADLGAAVPVTFTITTSKGAHRYFRQPEDGPTFGNGTGALRGYRLDVRGHHGYVVGPGSLHASGHEYRPVDPHVLPAPLPAWLASALRPPAPLRATPSREFRPGRERSALVGIVQVVLDAREGGRNSALYWSSCRVWERVRDQLLDAGSAAPMLLDAARQVGLPDREAEATVTSARRQVLGA